MSVASNKQYNLRFKKLKKKVNVLSEVFFKSGGKWCLKYSYIPFSDNFIEISDQAGVKKKNNQPTKPPSPQTQKKQISPLVALKEQQKEVKKLQSLGQVLDGQIL